MWTRCFWAAMSGTNKWRARAPPKDKPWYRILVHEAEHETYVAERNLEADSSGAPIRHPLLDRFFSQLDGDSYRPRSRHN